MKRAALLLACSAAASGCGQVDDAVLGVAIDGGPAPFPLYTAAQVASARASCQALPGNLTKVTSVAQQKSLLVGSWLSCNAPSDTTDAGADTFVSNVDGIQFTEDNEVRYLVLDPGGNLTNGVSPIHLINPEDLIPSSTLDGGDDGARISYSIMDSEQVNITFADGTSGGYFWTFESSPRRLSDDDGDSYVYVGP